MTNGENWALHSKTHQITVTTHDMSRVTMATHDMSRVINIQQSPSFFPQPSIKSVFLSIMRGKDNKQMQDNDNDNPQINMDTLITWCHHDNT